MVSFSIYILHSSPTPWEEYPIICYLHWVPVNQSVASQIYVVAMDITSIFIFQICQSRTPNYVVKDLLLRLWKLAQQLYSGLTIILKKYPVTIHCQISPNTRLHTRLIMYVCMYVCQKAGISTKKCVSVMSEQSLKFHDVRYWDDEVCECTKWLY